MITRLAEPRRRDDNILHMEVGLSQACLDAISTLAKASAAASTADERLANARRATADAKAKVDAEGSSAGGHSLTCLMEAGANPLGWLGCASDFIDNWSASDYDYAEALDREDTATIEAKNAHSYEEDARNWMNLECKSVASGGCGSRGGATVRNPNTGKCEGTRPCNDDRGVA